MPKCICCKVKIEDGNNYCPDCEVWARTALAEVKEGVDESTKIKDI